jgi:acyl-coenzyme A synthetase/AMP-(fatty) acid ligase
MIKVSGYRISPGEVEEIVYATRLVAEAAAVGLPHPELGQAIALFALAPGGAPLAAEALLAECRRRLPAYMVPAHVEVRTEALPRNPNGKIDRKLLQLSLSTLFESEPKP